MSHSHGPAELRSIDYLAYSSNLTVVHPGIKLTFSLLLIVFCVATQSIAASLFVALLSALVVIRMGKTKAHDYFSVLKIPLGFLLVGGIAIAIDFSGITADHIFRALRVMATALGAVSAMFMLTLTTPVGEIMDILYRIHVPKFFVELMNMIYRFIFIMSSVQNQMQVAAKSRLGYCTFQTGIKTFGSSLGNLLIVSLASANDYYDALKSRCYDGRLVFLTERKTVKMQHILFCASCVAVTVLLWLITR